MSTTLYSYNESGNVTVSVYYEVKPDFLPEDLQSLAVYVRPRELDLFFDPERWQLVGRTFHPNRLPAADVEWQGYCLRKLPSWLKAANWYNKKAA
jgi:hypothetical protein